MYRFCGSGQVFLDIQHTDPFNLKRSAGVGARIMINPIGSIGFIWVTDSTENLSTGKILPGYSIFSLERAFK